MELVKRFSLLTILENGEPVRTYPLLDRKRAMDTARVRARRHRSFVVLAKSDYEIWRGENLVRSRQQKKAGETVVCTYDRRPTAAHVELAAATG